MICLETLIMHVCLGWSILRICINDVQQWATRWFATLADSFWSVLCMSDCLAVSAITAGSFTLLARYAVVDTV